MASVTASEVFLLDASIYIFQAHFSPYVECRDRRGEDLSAVFGFSQFLLQLLARQRPRYLLVAHDESLFCGFRHELCPDYKSNRELPDDNLARQLRACSELCEILGLRAHSSKRYEADDIIGTVATRLRLDERQRLDKRLHLDERQRLNKERPRPKRERSQSEAIGAEASIMRIVTRDKDLAQLLLHEEDCLWDLQQNRRRYRADIVDELGVEPAQIPDYLGLAGDAVDCIKGVPGVGPVKARTLLQHFGSLKQLYENLGEVAQLPIRGAAGLAAKLEQHQEQARLSKQLATILCNIEDEGEEFARAELEALTVRTADAVGLASFLEQQRFCDADCNRIMGLLERL